MTVLVRSGVAGIAAAALAATALAPTASASIDQPGFLDPLGSAGSLDPTGSAGSLDPVGSLWPDFRPTIPGPDVETDVLADGLSIPWDVVLTPDGTMITGERDTGNVYAITPEGDKSTIDADFGELFNPNELGLMGMTLANDFAESRELFTCVSLAGSENDVRVIKWAVDEEYSALTEKEPIIEAIPRSGNGIHSGCSLNTHPEDGSIFVGTGDAETGSVPQDLASIGGKVLNVETDGAPGPHARQDVADGESEIVSTYGHRNVQGLAFQPGTNQLYTAEHGPDRDDEVNRHVVGGNYGWDPEVDGQFNQGVPMTDLAEFPDAEQAIWASGHPTLAPSGAAFLDGEQWGEFDGALAVAMLKTQQIMLLKLTEDGQAVEDVAVTVVREHGRLRSLTPDEDGNLLVTTSNGGGDDSIFRYTPAGYSGD